MTDEMIERVARAIMVRTDKPMEEWRRFEVEARAAIAAVHLSDYTDEEILLEYHRRMQEKLRLSASQCPGDP